MLTIIHVSLYKMWGSWQSQAREGQEICVLEAAAERSLGKRGTEQHLAPRSKAHQWGANKGIPEPSCLSSAVPWCSVHEQRHTDSAGSLKNRAGGSQVVLGAVGPPWHRKPERSDSPDGSDSGRTVLSWEKGGEQSGFVWCNPPELLPAPWGRWGLAQDKLHSHTHTHARWGSSLDIRLG